MSLWAYLDVNYIFIKRNTLTVMRGCDPPPLRMASAACWVAPLASAPRFLAIWIREARRRASSNLSVADGISWLGTTTIMVSRLELRFQINFVLLLHCLSVCMLLTTTKIKDS